MWCGSAIGRYCLLFPSKKSSVGYRRVIGFMEACVKYEEKEKFDEVKHKEWSEQDKLILSQMREKGHSWEEIAERLGRTKNAVRSYYNCQKRRKIEQSLNTKKIMEKQTITTKVETISPNTAMTYLKNAGKNRKLSEKKVQDYAKQMTDGEWVLNGEPIIFGKSGNLIDGQHRLRAVIYANARVQMLVVRGVNDEYFDSIDSGKSRSLFDVFSCNNVANSATVSSIVKKFYIICNNPKACFFKDYSHSTTSRKRMLEIYQRHAQAFDFAAQFGANMYAKKRLASPANIGAIYAYLFIVKEHEQEKIEEFFWFLFSNKEAATIPDYSASLEVRNRIISAALAGKKFEPKTLQNMFAVAWNAFIEGKEIKKLNVSNEEIIEFL